MQIIMDAAGQGRERPCASWGQTRHLFDQWRSRDSWGAEILVKPQPGNAAGSTPETAYTCASYITGGCPSSTMDRRLIKRPIKKVIADIR